MMRYFIILIFLLLPSVQASTINEMAQEFARTNTVTPQMASDLVKFADQGDTTAMRILAEIADKGINMNAASPEWGFNWTLKAARAGDPIASYELALRYFQQRGTPRGNSNELNKTRGIFWINRAAAALVPEALMLLAEAYKTGQVEGVSVGLTRSQDNFLRFLRLAAAQNHGPAYYLLFKEFHSPENSRFNENEMIARDYLEQCVELVEPNCLYEAAKIKLTGDEEIRDVGLGLAYLQQARQQGLKKAGLMHDVVVAMINGELDNR